MLRRELYDEYVAGLDIQYAEASQMLMDYIDSFDWLVDVDTAKKQRDQVMQFFASLVDVYGNNASTLAADFYFQAAQEAGMKIAEPLIGDMPRYESIASAVRYAARALWGGERDAESFRINCVRSLKKFIKQCGDRTMEANAKRDGTKGVKWARVPRGPETCAFCIMVASRGFVYASEDSAAFFGHSHENCDCDIVCGFDDEGLEGYDEQKYLDMYLESLVYNYVTPDDGGEPVKTTINAKESMNALRRRVYDDHAEHYRKVARDWYSRNSTKEKERVAKYREEHRDEINAKKREKRAQERADREKEAFMDALKRAVEQQEGRGE